MKWLIQKIICLFVLNLLVIIDNAYLYPQAYLPLVLGKSVFLLDETGHMWMRTSRDLLPDNIVHYYTQVQYIMAD